jgi:preprotein translocase subunit YajC
MLEQILNFIIPAAYADTAVAGAASPQSGGFSFFFMLALFLIFLYFGIWRPQNKRAKEQQNLMTGLGKGDEVITAGGIAGKINKLADQYLVLTIAANTDIVVQKSAVVSVLPKGTIKAIE